MADPPHRPAEHGTTTTTDVPIEVSDGVTRYADVVLPDGPGPSPAIVTQTADAEDVLGGSGTSRPGGTRR